MALTTDSSHRARPLFPLVIRMSFRDAHVNRSDSCELSTQNATNHEGQLMGVHGMGGYWAWSGNHQRWPANPDAVATSVNPDDGEGWRAL